MELNTAREIFRDEIDRAAGAHTFFDRTEIGFVRLREIGRAGDDLDALLRQPVRDRATIEAARSRESDGFSFEVG